MNYQQNRLKIKFPDSENISINHSQSAQDLFVLMCLNGKRNGTFLDLGCSHPISISNTYLLENKFNWTGVCIDIDSYAVSLFESTRKCKAYIQDATQLDFDLILKDFTSNHVDYLSLDLEPATLALDCLKTIPFDKIEFSVITFEHDSYKFGSYYKDESRSILENAGYKRICSDIKNSGYAYEDWYYNPKYVNYENIKILESNQKEWTDAIYC